jgi:hypothetical protein
LVEGVDTLQDVGTVSGLPGWLATDGDAERGLDLVSLPRELIEIMFIV